MNETFNVVISSKNKLPGDTNSSMTVKLKEDIYISNDEELHLCMQSFHMVKSFYSCQAGLNDHFQVLFKVPGEPIAIETFDRYLSPGNYDVRTLMQEIKRVTNNALFDITYDPKLNKYLYKNLFQQAIDVYIKCINSGIFFGFDNGKENQIFIPTANVPGTYSTKFINLSGYTNMIIKLSGDVNIENTISNIYGKDYNYDKILGILNISDVAPMDSIAYEDNGSCMFRHKVNSDKVSSFGIEIVNENGAIFPQMTDWILVLKFEISKRVNQFERSEAILWDINYYLASIYSYLNIPSRITFQDLLENRLNNR